MITKSCVIFHWLGWCPNSRALEVQAPLGANNSPAVVRSQGSDPAGNSIFPDWITAGAVLILFATLFVGGQFWWPFFVGGVLIVCLVRMHFHGPDGGC